MAKQSKPQKDTVRRVMHEFKHGELESGGGRKRVRNPRQAIAIALSEAGSSRKEGPGSNHARLDKTKSKERRGETAEARKEGKRAQDRTLRGRAAKTPAKGRADTARPDRKAGGDATGSGAGRRRPRSTRKLDGSAFRAVRR